MLGLARDWERGRGRGRSEGRPKRDKPPLAAGARPMSSVTELRCCKRPLGARGDGLRRRRAITVSNPVASTELRSAEPHVDRADGARAALQHVKKSTSRCLTSFA